jgi:hypothetical protein
MTLINSSSFSTTNNSNREGTINRKCIKKYDYTDSHAKDICSGKGLKFGRKIRRFVVGHYTCT